MKIFLELSSKNDPGAGVLVCVKTKALANIVTALLQEKKSKEAYDLLKRKAMVEAYIPAGQKIDENIIVLAGK